MEPRSPASTAEEGAPERPEPSEREAARRAAEPEPEPEFSGERLAEPEGSSDEDTTHGGAAPAPTGAGDLARQLSGTTSTTTHGGAEGDDGAQRLPTAAEFCGPTTGISLDGLLHMVELLGPRLTAETTTSDVCHTFIKPMTTPAGWADEATLTDAAQRWYKHSYVHGASGERRSEPPGGTRSLCVLWSKEEATAHMIGKPTHFLSQAWLYKFLDLVEALRSFVASRPAGSARVFFWFCCFAIDEHMPQAVPLRSVFREAIRLIGHTVMMISPWSEPLTLSRAWCIWELFCTASVGARFDVCLGPAEQAAFEAAILAPGGFEKITAAFAAVDVAQAEAVKPEDKTMIMEQAETGVGGLEGLNATAVGTLRRWFVEYVVGLGRRVRETGGAEGAFRMTVVANALGGMGEQEEGAWAMFKVANAVGELGAEEEAIELYEAAAAAYEAAADEEGAVTARFNLAISLMKLKRWADARRLLEAVLAFETERHGADHEATLKPRAGLATCMGEMGDSEGATREEEAVLAARMRTLGPTHKSTLKTRLNLATSYQRAGDLDRAARELEAVVEGRTATLGPRHAGTLHAQANLGNTRLNMGDVAGAVALLEVAAPGLEAAGHYQAAWARERLEAARQARAADAVQRSEQLMERLNARMLAASPGSREAASPLPLPPAPPGEQEQEDMRRTVIMPHALPSPRS
eukprot:COSAG04_NODE_894_length_9593_cov_18.225932_3_plen_694_part_00